MANDFDSMNEMHWLIDMVQTMEVALIVVDNNYNVQLWNGFMENHSGISPRNIKGKNLFKEFPYLPESWLKKKMETVFLLKNHCFISWEQKPYIFRFKSSRPITGQSDFMYQNVTLNPLMSLTGEVTHLSIIIQDVTEIAINKIQLKEANDNLRHLSQTDGLTQLNNRRFWETCLNSEYDRLFRYGGEGALVMFDIDHFKKVNDTYGHIAGDMVIQLVSGLLRKSLRGPDIAGRYGGEEFAVILVNTKATEALYFTERLRRKIEESEVNYEGQIIKITVSFGISGFTTEANTGKEWLALADLALYEAKETGRNRSIIYAPK